MRGYDPLPLLPVMTGRVVDSLEVSERFLWDVRQTVNDLLVRELRRPFPRPGPPHGIAALHRGLRRRARRRHDLWRPGRRAHGRVLVVGQVRRRLQLHRDGLRGPRLWPAHSGRRGLHRHRRRKVAGPSRPTSRTWGTGPSARASTASSSTAMRSSPGPTCRPGMSMGPWGLHYERTETWWEQSRGVARVSGPLPVPAPTGPIRGRPLLPRAGELPATLQVPGQIRLRPAGLQFRRLPAGGGAHPHERAGWPAGVARRHELPVAGAAPGGFDDPEAAGQNQGASRRRRHRRRGAAP